MGLFDFGTSDISSVVASTPNAPQTYSSSGGDFGNESLVFGPFNTSAGPKVQQPTESAPAAGLNLLLIDPGQFFNQLFGGNPNDIPAPEAQRAATTPVSTNFPDLLKAPTWIKVTILGVGVVAALFAVGYAVRSFR